MNDGVEGLELAPLDREEVFEDFRPKRRADRLIPLERVKRIGQGARQEAEAALSARMSGARRRPRRRDPDRAVA